MKSLMCMMVGDGSMFVVDIDDRKKVAHLKEVIKEMKMYGIAADQLTLYVAKKGGNWLKTDDPDVLQLEQGVVAPAITSILIEKNEMDPGYRVCNSAFGFPDEDAAEDCEIHVLVVVPATAPTAVGTTASLWRVRGSIADALDTKGVRGRLYRLAGRYLGFYDPARCTGGKNSALWYEGKTLCVHILFETKEYALLFDNALHEEELTIGSPLHGQEVETSVDQVPGLPNDQQLQRIYPNHYEPQDAESPQDTESSLSATTSLIDSLTDEFKYQRIEREAVFGSLGMALSCRVMSHEHCKNHASYHKYDRDKSNRLALSPAMHSWYDGLSCSMPAMNIRVESVSERPVVDGRYEVKLIVRAFDASYSQLMFPRLKEGATATSDPLEMKTSVYVENPTVFCTCMEWKYEQIQKQWEDYFSMESAVD